MIIQAKLISLTIADVEVMDAPLGKIYLVDLDTKQPMLWINSEHDVFQTLDCVMDIEEGKYIPCAVLEYLI
jgi:hypothetical protein